MVPDAVASRAFYAAFYTVSALFALQGKTFSKHSALEAAVHRDLVKTGHWSVDLGADYSFLRGLRATGDYSGGIYVSEEEAVEAIKAAHRIIQAVHKMYPEAFPDVGNVQGGQLRPSTEHKGGLSLRRNPLHRHPPLSDLLW